MHSWIRWSLGSSTPTSRPERLTGLSGLELEVAPTPDGVFSRAIDTSQKMALVGPCPVDWRTGLRMMRRTVIRTCSPEWVAPGGRPRYLSSVP